MNKKRKSTDVHESNAGHDFHIIWAVRKSLDLLNFDEKGLKSIAIENLDSGDANDLDPDGDLLLGVDMTEYFGGIKLENSDKVVVSQLKYSTRHPDLEWTAARLCQGKKGVNGSIIHRFSAIFQAFLDSYDNDEVVRKLKIKLVSNRPISPKLISIKNKLNGISKSLSTPLTLQQLKNEISELEKREIEKLVVASGLSEEDIIDFLYVLDFVDCNADDRFSLKRSAVSRMSEFGIYDLEKEYNDLSALIRSKTLPESRNKNTISKEDILLKFEFPDMQTLFPVRNEIESLTYLVDREQLLPISQSIIKNTSNRVICLHGTAGIGKSTISNTLIRYLPPSSVSILLDSYGGGSYIYSNDKRHLHQNALLYICNELALKTSSPFLISRNNTSQFYIQEFGRRLGIAAKNISAINTEAIIAILIDAADNSFTASNSYHEENFISDLLKIELPNNVRLILTTRTNRVESLPLPLDYLSIEINPFSLNETREYLRINFNNSSESDVQEFHRLTNAIPRVMSYALEIEGASIEEKLGDLKPHGKDLNQIFRDNLNKIKSRSNNSEKFEEILKYFVELPRPIPMNVVIKAAKTDYSFIQDLMIDMWKGVIFENDHFRFRDEDFESYLRSIYKFSEADLLNVSNILIENADINEYCSKHLASILVKANRINELHNIVLNKTCLGEPVDPISNREILIERTRLAMENASKSSDKLMFLKLQFIAAEASKTNKALEEISKKNSDLITMYGNENSISNLLLHSRNIKWFGSLYFRNAAILSRSKNTHSLAYIDLNKAEDWMRYRDSLDENEQNDFPVTEKDIAYGAEAILRIEGVISCTKWLKRWRPKTFVYTVVKSLIQSVLIYSAEDEIKRWLREFNSRLDIKLLINQVFFQNGFSPPFVNLESSLIFKELKYLKLELSLKRSLLSYSEYLYSKNTKTFQIEQILRLIESELPDHVPNFYGNLFIGEQEILQLDLFLKHEVLKSKIIGNDISANGIIETKIKPRESPNSNRQYDKSDTVKYGKIIEYLLRGYLLRIEVIKGNVKLAGYKKEIVLMESEFEKDYQFKHSLSFQSSGFKRFLLLLQLETAYFIKNTQKAIDFLVNENKLEVETALNFAGKLSINKMYNVNVEVLLNSLDVLINSAEYPASKKIEIYTATSLIASRVSSNLGKKYFDKLIVATTEVDQEVYYQIRLVADLLDFDSAYNINDPNLTIAYAKFVEYCSIRLGGYDHFPWNAAVSAISKMDPLSALSIIAQWDHRGVCEIDENIAIVFLEWINQELIDPVLFSSLLFFNEYYNSSFRDFVDKLFALLKSNTYFEVRSKVLKNLIAFLKLRFNSDQSVYILREFLNILRKHQYLQESIIQEFSSYCERIESFIPKKENARRFKNKPKKRIVFEGERFVENKSLENYLDNLIKENKINSAFLNPNEILDEIIPSLKPHQYVEHLNSFMDLPSDIINGWSFANGIIKRVNSWKEDLSVKKWKELNIDRIIRRVFKENITNDHIYTGCLTDIFNEFKIDQKTRAEFIIKLIHENIRELTDESIYFLFDFTKLSLEDSEMKHFISWVVKKLEGAISNNFNPQYSILDNRNPDVVISNLYRYALGHFDKSIRWRAAKSLVKLIDYGNSNILDNLLKNQNKIECEGFQAPQYYFYWISSKLWLWISIRKISFENPTSLMKVAGLCLDELENKIIPHAQIRLFIKYVCLNLIKSNCSIYTIDEISRINSVLTPPLAIEKKKRKGNKITYKDLKFPFNAIDTLDYWYEPLGRLFGLSSYEIAKMAERYIYENWSYTGDLKTDNYVNGNKSDIYFYKSDMPSIENLKIYFEYHALHCVANELLDSVALNKDEVYLEKWEDWLKGYDLMYGEFWLSDLQDSIPVQKIFWNRERVNEFWQFNIGRKELNEIVGLENPDKPGYIIVNAEEEIHYGNDYETRSVHSALVDEKVGNSLLRAIQIGDKYGYYLHEESESYDEEQDCDVNPNYLKFSIEGWVTTAVPQFHSVDESDETIRRMMKRELKIGEKFVDLFKLNFSLNKKLSFTDKDVPVTILKTWNNVPKEITYGNFASGGQRLYVETYQILRYLKERKKALILNAHITRSVENSNLDFNERTPWYSLYYLIYSNGKIETLGRNFKIRKETGRRI